MANEEHLRILKQGVEAWNKWREENPDTEPDLRGANLSRANLSGANLSRANLREANVERALVGRSRFGDVDLSVVSVRKPV